MDNLEGFEKRPNYSALDNFILKISDIYEFPTWQKALSDYINEMGD